MLHERLRPFVLGTLPVHHIVTVVFMLTPDSFIGLIQGAIANSSFNLPSWNNMYCICPSPSLRLRGLHRSRAVIMTGDGGAKTWLDDEGMTRGLANHVMEVTTNYQGRQVSLHENMNLFPIITYIKVILYVQPLYAYSANPYRFHSLGPKTTTTLVLQLTAGRYAVHRHAAERRLRPC